MIRSVLFIFICLSASAPAYSQTPLAEGIWTGWLSPMNHPEMQTPLVYHVSTTGDHIGMTLAVPEGDPVSVRGLRVDADTLRFVFNEPEERVLLRCALGGDGAGGYEGKCADEEGKWAFFTMRPPEE